MLSHGFIFLVFLAMIAIQQWIYFEENKKALTKIDRREIYAASKMTRAFGKAKSVLLLMGLVSVAWRCFSPMAEIIPIGQFVTGVVISLSGLGLLKWSLQALGENYAPCNWVRMPDARVTRGPYRFLGHPIYCANLTLLAGILWACPGILGLLSWIGLLIFYVFSARDENRALARLVNAAESNGPSPQSRGSQDDRS